jgi:F-type H+-transporting ATPase subunit epsilon
MNVIVTTIEEVLFEGRADHVVVPAVDGEMTILMKHAPTITALKAGIVRVKEKDGSEKDFAVVGGFLETDGHKVTICERAA